MAVKRKFTLIPQSKDYYVKFDGRIYKKRAKRFYKLNPSTAGKYPTVKITYLGGDRKTKRVHRLVAETLIPNPSNYPMVLHMDDDTKNYHPSNLIWGDAWDNTHDMIDKGRLVKGDKANYTKYKLELCEEVVEKFHIKGLTSRQIEEQMGLSQTTVSRIVNGKIYNGELALKNKGIWH